MYSVFVDPDRLTKTVSKYIYGHFIEHLGRCIYGGIYEEGSSLSDERGFRKDVMEAVKKLKVPILRWPGGNFASNYHWEDGIGPKDQRPARFDLAWRRVETNRFGTDEYIEYCREIGAEPYICVNLGTGTLDEALRWLEYCNGEGKTYYANLRRKYGCVEPYGVKFWGIGNEMYGEWQVNHMNANEYAKTAKEYARWMKVLDPSIKTVAVGCDDPEWNLKVLNIAGAHIDYLSYHFYTGSEDYYETVSTVYLLKERLLGLKKLIDMSRASQNKQIKIALDEWNVWYRVTEDGLEEPYELKDGLFACGVLITLQKMSDIVPIANLAQLVNALGAIHTESNGLYLTPVYKAFELLANHSGQNLVETHIETETYDIDGRMFFTKTPFKLRDVPYMDASATVSADGKKLYLAVVNYKKEDAVKVSITVKGMGEKIACAHVLSGPDVHTRNSMDHPNVVDIMCEQINVASQFIHVFKPFSCTVIEIERD